MSEQGKCEVKPNDTWVRWAKWKVTLRVNRGRSRTVAFTRSKEIAESIAVQLERDGYVDAD